MKTIKVKNNLSQTKEVIQIAIFLEVVVVMDLIKTQLINTLVGLLVSKTIIKKMIITSVTKSEIRKNQVVMKVDIPVMIN